LEVVEMAKKQQREPASIETRERAVQMVKEDGQPGAQARVARHFGVSQAAVSYWLSHPLPKKRGRQAGYNKPQQTMFSPPSSNGPPSGPVSVGADTLPALPTVQLTGLEEYIRALVKVEVRNELRRRLND
jgi:transposase-like protein